VRFVNCKLLGVDFSGCQDFLFSVAFTGCTLDYAYFGKKNFKKTTFKSSSIKEANFTDTDLTSAVFLDCDLQCTVFQGTNLEKADFTSAYNYAMDPDQNRIKKAKFSQQGALGLLAKYDIIIK
jgi:fluoroquinolone resistance protein